MSIKTLKRRLKNSYERIVYPSAMGDIPIELEKMAKYDADENIIGYYSINELSRELGGDFLKPMNFNKAKTLKHIRWSFDKEVTDIGVNIDEQATRELLLSKGLVNMRAGVKVKDLDIASMTGYEFGIFGTDEFGDIPTEKIKEENINEI